MAKQFNGEINLDVRDSVSDWDAFLPEKARAGAPNVLVVLYDDTGSAAWSPYGGRINMPTMDRLAADGLTYSQWHTTALCSPKRSTFLTGRNHHSNGFASISESLVFLAVTLMLVYRFGPDVGHTYRSVMLGAGIAVVAWLLTSTGFSVYLAYFANYGATYGSLGAAIGLLFYLYLSAAVVLVGAEVNAVVYRRVRDEEPERVEVG